MIRQTAVFLLFVLILLLHVPSHAENDEFDIATANCTKQEAKDMAHRFRKSGKGDDDSRCPRETWLEAMAAVSEQPSRLLLINVGFNKGYNFAIWSALFAPWTGINPMNWFQAIDRTDTYPNWREACGKCSDCGIKVNGTKWPFSKTETFVDMIGIDLNFHNIVLNKKTLKFLSEVKDVNFDRINITTILAGGSDKEGSMLLPTCETGDESCSLTNHDMASASMNIATNDSVLVPLITVAKLVHDLESGKKVTKKNSGEDEVNRKVDILMIDTEGYDPLVLEGAKPLLEQSRIRSIIFEYHGIGPWLNHLLQNVVNMMDGYGLDCYFQGNGRLWRLTGCWDNAYESHWWSNVMW